MSSYRTGNEATCVSWKHVDNQKSQDGDKSLIQNIVKNHICSGRIY